MKKDLQMYGGVAPTREAVIYGQLADMLEQKNTMDMGIISHRMDRTLKQQEFHDHVWTHYTNAPSVTLFLGALGAGKTKTLVEEVFEYLEKFPGVTGMIIRKTYGELAAELQRDIINGLNERGIPFKKNDEQHWIRFPDGSELLFRSCDDPTKLTTAELGFVIMDQAEEIEEHFLSILFGKLRQKVPHRAFMISANPPDENHWLHSKFVKENNHNYKVVHVSIDDNPHLPEDVKENLKKEYRSSPSLYNRYIKGLWGASTLGKPVYWNIFNSDVHTGEVKYNPLLPIYRSWDFGYHHPCVTFYQKGGDDRVYGIGELLGDRILLSKFIIQVEKYQNEKFFNRHQNPLIEFYDCCDIAGSAKSDKSEISSIDILRENGIYPKFRMVGINSGIEEVSKLLSQMIGGKPAIMWDKTNCSYIIRTMELGYSWEKNPTKQITKRIPIKDGYYEHGADTTRYAVVNFFSPKVSGRYGKKIQKAATAHYGFGKKSY